MASLNMVEINIVDLQKLKKRVAELYKENQALLKEQEQLEEEIKKLKPKKKEQK